MSDKISVPLDIKYIQSLDTSDIAEIIFTENTGKIHHINDKSIKKIALFIEEYYEKKYIWTTWAQRSGWISYKELSIQSSGKWIQKTNSNTRRLGREWVKISNYMKNRGTPNFNYNMKNLYIFIFNDTDNYWRIFYSLLMIYFIKYKKWNFYKNMRNKFNY